MPRKAVTPEVLKQLFTYDPDTGVLTRRSTMKPVYLEIRKRKQVQLELYGSTYNARRVIIAIMTNRWPEPHEYKFVGEDPRDTRWSNFIRIKDGELRRCNKCGEMKHQSNFQPAGTNLKSFQSHCNTCIKDVSAFYSRRRTLREEYGITEEEYNEQLELQGGGCAICGTTAEENGKALAVDHCHKSNELRGILCSKCNTGLGLFRDSPNLMLKAAKYLLEHKAT